MGAARVGLQKAKLYSNSDHNATLRHVIFIDTVNLRKTVTNCSSSLTTINGNITSPRLMGVTLSMTEKH